MEAHELLSTMDGKVWADEFMATKARIGEKEFDHAMMLAWFANAIMAGFDEANRRSQQTVERLERELNALKPKYQQLVAFYDQHNGTPCEQIRHQQEIAQLRESRQCAETYMLILADKLQFSSSQFPQLSSGWCEELVNTITALQSQLAVAQAQVLEAQDGVNALLEASSDRCRKHEQQVAQLRENVSKIECELSEWKLASAANETGHLFRCARVNGKWSCAKGCHAAAHTTLRGLVREVMEAWVNGRKVCDGIPLSLRERVDATLPREGATSHGGEHE